MAVPRSAVMLLGVACAFAAGGLLFTLPSIPGAHRGQQTGALSERPEAARFTQFEAAETSAATSSASTSLLVGICLGLLVGLTSYAAPAEAKAARGVLEYLTPLGQETKPGVDFDLAETENLKKMNADAKKRYKLIKAVNDADERAAQALMKPNYARVSTGGGNYKQYKMDLAYPIKAIPDRDDGTYDFGKKAPPPRKPGLGGRVSALLPVSGGFVTEAEKNAVKEEYSWFITKPTKYGNFYSASAPYKYKEQPRFREKMFGEYGQKAADYTNAMEAAAKKK